MTTQRLAALVADAGLDEWLATLPDGVDTEVGARGLRLSLGGRQIVALLRALATYPGLVLLDEPTANLDPETDRQVRHALRRRFAGRTCVMIAHRLSTMRDLDLIAVMDRGRLVEFGPHDELAAGRGRYAALYDTYLTEQVHGRR
jgi:ABC-type multidrug transport system fused ATPase/permease subunit